MWGNSGLKLHKCQDGKLRCKKKYINKNIRPRFQVNLIHDWRIRPINSAFISMQIKQYQYQRITKQIKSALQTFNLARKWTIESQQTRSQRWMEHSHQAGFSNPAADVSTIVSIQSLVLIGSMDRFGAVVFTLRSPIISPKLCPFSILTRAISPLLLYKWTIIVWDSALYEHCLFSSRVIPTFFFQIDGQRKGEPLMNLPSNMSVLGLTGQAI